jgi:hypothetical protein
VRIFQKESREKFPAMKLKRRTAGLNAGNEPSRTVAIPDIPEFLVKLAEKSKGKPKKGRYDTKGIRRFVRANGIFLMTEVVELFPNGDVWLLDRGTQKYITPVHEWRKEILGNIEKGNWKEITEKEWREKTYSGAYQGVKGE